MTRIGAPLRDIVAEAAKDVGKYLFSASLVIILVFLPLLTLQGLEGAMFRPTAFAVAAALFAAMLLNITLQPVLAVVFLSRGKIKDAKDPVTDFLAAKYKLVMEKALSKRTIVLVLFFVLPSGGRGAGTFLSVHRSIWASVHDYAGLLFIALLVLHLVLHYRYLRHLDRHIAGPNSAQKE